MYSSILYFSLSAIGMFLVFTKELSGSTFMLLFILFTIFYIVLTILRLTSENKWDRMIHQKYLSSL